MEMNDREEMHRHLRSFCFPVFQPLDEDDFQNGINVGGVEFLGTAIPLQIGDHHFVVTAQHVANVTGTTQLVYPVDEERMTNVVGNRVTFNREVVPNNYDISVFRVEDLRLIDTYDWIDLDQILFSGEPTLEGVIHIACGYPGTQQSAWGRENNVRVQCYSFEWMSKPYSAYEEEGLTPRHHVALEFDGTMHDADGRELQAPRVRGMSGGPIWAGTDDGYKVIGVVTHHLPASDMVYGTRIEFAIYQISEVFTDLQPLIEEYTP